MNRVDLQFFFFFTLALFLDNYIITAADVLGSVHVCLWCKKYTTEQYLCLKQEITN